MDTEEGRNRAIHGLRSSILNNSTAYAFSVMITVVLLATQQALKPVTTGRLFLFALGATIAFAGVEAVATAGFRVRVRPDPSEAVALGSAFAVLSVTLGLGAAVLALQVVSGAVGWFVAPFAGTVMYVAASGLEMAFGRWQEERIRAEQEEEDPPESGGDDASEE